MSVPGGSDDEGTGTGPETLVCERCGTRAETPRPTWTCAVQNGTRTYFCETCSRKNLRAIEGRLDSAWW